MQRLILAPCPQVRWEGNLILDQHFVIYKASKESIDIVTNNLNENILTPFEEKEKGHTESDKLIRRPE